MIDFIAMAIGYIFAIAIAHPFIYLVSARLWSDIESDNISQSTLRPRPWHASLTGLVERALYMASLQISQPMLIGIWLALKTVGNWKRWSHGYPSNAEIQKVTGREFLNIFLIGSGLSIAYALVGFKIVYWIKKQNFLYVISVPLILIACTILLNLYIYLKTRKNRLTKRSTSPAAPH